MLLKEAAVMVAVLATATAPTTQGASHSHKDTLTPSPSARPNYFEPTVMPPSTTRLSTTLTPTFITGLPLIIKTPIRHKQGTNDTSSPHTRSIIEILRHKRSMAETASLHKRSTTETSSREHSSSNTSLRHKQSTSGKSFAVEKKSNYTLPTLLVDLFLPSISNSNEDDTSKDISSSEEFQSKRSEENDSSTPTVSHRLHQSTTTSLEDPVLEAISVNDQKKGQSSEKHPLSSTSPPTKTSNHRPSIRFDDSQPLVNSTRHTSAEPKENLPSASEHPDSNPRPLSPKGKSEAKPTEPTLSGTPSRPMLFTPNKVIPTASPPTPTAPKPTLNARPSKPTLKATPFKPSLTVAPSNLTLTATSSKPTQIATPSKQAPTASRPALIVAPSKPTPTIPSEQEEDHPSNSGEGDLLESTVASILSTSSSVEESEHTSSENDITLSSPKSAENHNASTSTSKADMEESASVIKKYFYDFPFSPALDQFVAPSQASTLLEFLSKPAGKFTEPSEFTGGSLSSLYSSFPKFSTPPPDKYQIPATHTHKFKIPDEYKLDSPFESDLSYDPESFEPDTPTPSTRHPKPPADESIYTTSSKSATASTENFTSGEEEEVRPKFPRSSIHNLISPMVSPALYPYKPKPLLPYLYPKSIPHYAFDYLVDDKVRGTYFGHSESREGYDTRGKYYVQLPDGRLQTVSYTANQTGYFPNVAYTGTAKHPVPIKYPIKIPKPLYVPSKPEYGPVTSALPHKLLHNTVTKPIHPISLKPLHYTSARPQTSHIPSYVLPYSTKPKLKPTHIPKPVKVPYIPPVYHPIITSTTTSSPLSTTHHPAITSTTNKPASHTVTSTLKPSPKPIMHPATPIYTTSKPSHATSYRPAITIKPSGSPFKPTITYSSHKPVHTSTVPANPYDVLYRPLKSHFKIITKPPSFSIKPSPIPVKSSVYTKPRKTTFRPSKPIPVDPDHPFTFPKYRYEPVPLPSTPTELELKSTHSSKAQTKKYPYPYLPSLLDKKYPVKLKSKSSLARLLSHQHVTPSPYPVTSMFPGPYPPDDSTHPNSPGPLIPELLFRELHSLSSLLEDPPVTLPPPAPPRSPHPLTPSPISHILSSRPTSHTLPSLGSAEYLGDEFVHPSTSSNPHLGHPHSPIPSSPSHMLSPHPISHTLPSFGSAEYLNDQYTHSSTSSHELSLSDYIRQARMLEASHEAPFNSSEDPHTTMGYDSRMFINPLYRMPKKDHLGLEAIHDASKEHI